MKTLFLDDNQERIEIALTHFPDCTIVKTASECIESLKKDQWDLVMLDNDLDEIIKDKAIVGCGVDVAKWICQNKPIIRNVLIHSRNHYAIIEMTELFQENKIKFMQICFFDIDWNNLKKNCNLDIRNSIYKEI